jgi:hypothetical protein
MEAGGWLKKACEDHRVVLLDQVRMHGQISWVDLEFSLSLFSPWIALF